MDVVDGCIQQVTEVGGLKGPDEVLENAAGNRASGLSTAAAGLTGQPDTSESVLSHSSADCGNLTQTSIIIYQGDL